MNLDHLKLCVDLAHVGVGGYACARCHDTYCSVCDRRSDERMVKTIVRYCPDWRCRREERIERMNVGSVAIALGAEVRSFVRDRFTPGSLRSLDELEDMVTSKVAEAVGRCVYTPDTIEHLKGKSDA